jgi:cytoskeleton protein RodZ
MESLGTYLKREREYRSISLHEVARSTKIREDLLTALEEDHLDSQISSVFVKGFLRSYAKYVGLNPDDVVLRYEASLREDKNPGSKKGAADAPRQWVLRYIALPTAILLGVGILLFLALDRARTTETETGTQRTVKAVEKSISQTESPMPIERRAEEASATLQPTNRRETALPSPPPHPIRPTPSPISKRSSGIELRLRALEDTWLRVRVDQEPAREILLRQGETISKRGERNIEMTVGNAGGLEIFYNGRNLRKLGGSGEVVYLSIDPETVKTQRLGRSRSKKP